MYFITYLTRRSSDLSVRYVPSKLLLKTCEIISIINEELFNRPLHENIRAPKFLGSGTTQFHKEEVLANDIHS